MIFYECEFEGLPLVNYKKVQVISRKAFQEYKAKSDQYENPIQVVGGTNLTVIKDRGVTDDVDALVTADKVYRIIPKVSAHPKGYIAVSDTQFVAVNSPSIIPELGMLLATVALLVGWFLRSGSETFNPVIESMQIGAAPGAVSTDGGDAISESTSVAIPGYGACINTITLVNPKENPVFLRYTLYAITSAETIKTFIDTIEAQTYYADNKPAYVADTEKQCFVNMDTSEEVQDATVWTLVDDGYAISEEHVHYVRATDMISPGYEVTVDFTQLLNPGDYTLRIVTGTYDLATGAEGYGTVQNIEIEVE